MDLIYNALMASVKTSAERTGTPSKSGEGDPFQKLMDQKQNAKDPAAAQQETAESTENAVQQPHESGGHGGHAAEPDCGRHRPGDASDAGRFLCGGSGACGLPG